MYLDEARRLEMGVVVFSGGFGSPRSEMPPLSIRSYGLAPAGRSADGSVQNFSVFGRGGVLDGVLLGSAGGSAGELLW